MSANGAPGASVCAHSPSLTELLRSRTSIDHAGRLGRIRKRADALSLREPSDDPLAPRPSRKSPRVEKGNSFGADDGKNPNLSDDDGHSGSEGDNSADEDACPRRSGRSCKWDRSRNYGNGSDENEKDMDNDSADFVKHVPWEERKYQGHREHRKMNDDHNDCAHINARRKGGHHEAPNTEHEDCSGNDDESAQAQFHPDPNKDDYAASHGTAAHGRPNQNNDGVEQEEQRGTNGANGVHDADQEQDDGDEEQHSADDDPDDTADDDFELNDESEPEEEDDEDENARQIPRVSLRRATRAYRAGDLREGSGDSANDDFARGHASIRRKLRPGGNVLKRSGPSTKGWHRTQSRLKRRKQTREDRAEHMPPDDHEEPVDDETDAQRRSRNKRRSTRRGLPERRVGNLASGGRARQRERKAAFQSDDSLEEHFGPVLDTSLTGTIAGGSSHAEAQPSARNKEKADKKDTRQKDAEVTPMRVDPSLTFDSIGGLQTYVQALKEMVYLPLMYPEVFDRFKVTPPRGVLLHGPPGTGKTLIARALAASCERAGTKVAFFMRKGADVLSKWVGESERQLRVLFEEAQKHEPSIVFFDEIDGLAPLRSSKQDQIHNSVVSTLLAHMDGLSSRGQVVVIGSTNRPDAIDAALRRPGRFDRELAFPLPNSDARMEILKVHTRDWAKRPSDFILQQLAAECVGYCGADLKALCTEAAVHALRRRYPQIYKSDKKLCLDPNQINVEIQDFEEARGSMVPASHRSSTMPAKPLTQQMQALLGHARAGICERICRLFPPADDAGIRSSYSCTRKMQSPNLLSTSGIVQRSRLIVCGEEGSGQVHLGPALLNALESFPVRSIGLPSLLSDTNARSPEEALVRAFSEARQSAPSVLFLPHIQSWWTCATETMRTTLGMLLEDTPPDLPVFMLALADVPSCDLDEYVMSLFKGMEQTYHIERPSSVQRQTFFQHMIETIIERWMPSSKYGDGSVQEELEECEEQEMSKRTNATKEGKQNEQTELATRENEEQVLRQLRMVLRVIVEKVILDKRFRAFSAPISEDEHPDFYAKVTAPMDLATLLWQLNEGCYPTVKRFLNDFALIRHSVFEYFGSPPDSMVGINMTNCAQELDDVVRELIQARISSELATKCEHAVARREAKGESVVKELVYPASIHHRRKQDAEVQAKEDSGVYEQGDRAHNLDAHGASDANANASEAEHSRKQDDCEMHARLHAEPRHDEANAPRKIGTDDDGHLYPASEKVRKRNDAASSLDWTNDHHSALEANCVNGSKAEQCGESGSGQDCGADCPAERAVNNSEGQHGQNEDLDATECSVSTPEDLENRKTILQRQLAHSTANASAGELEQIADKLSRHVRDAIDTELTGSTHPIILLEQAARSVLVE